MHVLAFDKGFGIVRRSLIKGMPVNYYLNGNWTYNILFANVFDTRKEAQDIIDQLNAGKEVSVSNPDNDSMEHFQEVWISNNQDPGAHYRYSYKGIKLDPFRIAKIYGMTEFPLQTILKKVLKCGERGQKNKRQDLLDIISAAQRAIEIIDEDSVDKVKT